MSHGFMIVIRDNVILILRTLNNIKLLSSIELYNNRYNENEKVLQLNYGIYDVRTLYRAYRKTKCLTILSKSIKVDKLMLT